MKIEMLMFISGGGFGCLLAFFLMLILIRKVKTKGDEWNEKTLELMRERNEIARHNLEISEEKQRKIYED